MKNLGLLFSILLFPPFQAFAQQTVNIGYFNEWPLPAQFGRETGAFREALGAPVNWRAFDNGQDISTALANDNIQVALSQGVVPIMLAANAGQDIQIVDIAVSYVGIENCVVRARLNITAENASELEGVNVGVPIGTTVHFSLIEQMKHLGADISKMQLIDLPPARAAAALANGDVDMACGWGPALEQMKKRGSILMNAEELSAIGVLAFDAVIVQGFYGTSNSETLANILNTNDKLTFGYSNDRSGMLKSIATSVAMTEAAAADTLSMFIFPSIEEKLGDAWMGGGVQTYLKSLADFFVEQGTMNNALDSYDKLINPDFLRAVQALQLNETTNDPAVLAPEQQN